MAGNIRGYNGSGNGKKLRKYSNGRTKDDTVSKSITESRTKDDAAKPAPAAKNPEQPANKKPEAKAAPPRESRTKDDTVSGGGPDLTSKQLKPTKKKKKTLEFGKPGIGVSGRAYGPRAYNYATGTSPDPINPHY